MARTRSGQLLPPGPLAIPASLHGARATKCRNRAAKACTTFPGHLTDLFHREDPTRKVTAGCNDAGAARNGFADTLDVYGYNYKPWAYKAFSKDRPDQPFYASETSSCVSTRGEYFFPVDWNESKGFFLYQVSSYDLYAPGWAYRPDVEFAAQDDNPNSAKGNTYGRASTTSANPLPTTWTLPTP